MPTVSSTTGSKWLRILIADDDRNRASMLALVLRDEGHEVSSLCAATTPWTYAAFSGQTRLSPM
jgi:hypothetical protein